jgi:hypothetical protein
MLAAQLPVLTVARHLLRQLEGMKEHSAVRKCDGRRVDRMCANANKFMEEVTESLL